MGTRTWMYTTYGTLFIMEVILLIVTFITLLDPFFLLIPIEKYDPYILAYAFVNFLQAILCGVSIFALYRSYVQIVVYSHWISSFTLLIDGIMAFIFSGMMSDAHVSLQQHILELYNDKNDNCKIWDDVYNQLQCCPPSFALKSCYDVLNISKSYCALDHSNDCYVHLRRWLHTNTELVGLCAFCGIVPLKMFMCCALRKDIEEVETELEEKIYFAQMTDEIDRHGDGYIEKYQSKSNIFLATEHPSKPRSAQYSPFIKESVIEEVENEFTIRGDEIRDKLMHAMTAHSSSSSE